jgi:hypothetical protein
MNFPCGKRPMLCILDNVTAKRRSFKITELSIIPCSTASNDLHNGCLYAEVYPRRNVNVGLLQGAWNKLRIYIYRICIIMQMIISAVFPRIEPWDLLLLFINTLHICKAVLYSRQRMLRNFIFSNMDLSWTILEAGS